MRRAAALAGASAEADRCWTSPGAAYAADRAIVAVEAPMCSRTLRDCDYGRWAGSSFDDVCRRASRMRLRHGCTIRRPRRTAANRSSASYDGSDDWLADEQAQHQRAIVVTHPAVIRAAIVHAIEAAPQSFWRIDIAPLSITRLSSSKAVDGIFSSRLHGHVK